MYKQVIVVRKDLGLSPGKMAAQCAHASLKAYQNSDKKVREVWESEGGKKVVVLARDRDELLELHQKAKKLKIPAALIKDAGRTELEPGTITCLGLGPDSEEKMDRLTSSLPLA